MYPNILIAPPPVPDDYSADEPIHVFADTKGLVMFKSCKYKDEAWEFIKWVFSNVQNDISMRVLGLLNSLSAVIVPSLMSAWGIFMFTQSYKSVPNEYIEAAKMDGANDFWVILRLMLPLSRSTASIVGMFTFIGIWDNFMWPLIVIRDYNKMPLSVLLASFNKEYGSYVGPILAGSVIQTIPMVLIFLIFRKYFLQGISMSLK